MLDILSLLQKSGLRDWGICSFDQIRPFLLKCRAANRLPENAMSVLMTVFPYHVECGAHNISRYAIPPDYHTVAGVYLERACKLLREAFPAEKFVWFADNSPIPEVRAAALCGLGVVGLHTLLITPRYGSWVFLGEIVTSLSLPVTGKEIQACSLCGNCRTACPGNALRQSGLQTAQCLSHISQKKGELTAWEQDVLRKGGSAWGCDLCQEVCPMNHTGEETYLPEFREKLFPLILPGQSQAIQNRAFHWRGPKIIERNLKILAEEPISHQKIADSDPNHFA